MAITSSFTNLATVTRASKKTDAGGWDFSNGGTVGTLTEYASGVAAIHPTAGLLVEEASTNEIRNPRCEGASGSSAPTYWSVSAAGLTINYETVNINGWPGVRITLSGTASGNLQFIADVGFTSSSETDVFTASAGLILEAGSLPTGFEFGLQHRNASSLVEADSAVITDADSSHRRYFLTGTVDTAGVDTTNWFMRAPSLAEAVSCTFVVLAPQLEESDYATSPILPDVGSPAASTRAADAITVPLGAWFDAAAMTHFMEYTLPHNSKAASTLYAFSIGDGGGTDVIAVGGYTAGSTARAYVVTSAAAVVNFSNANPGDGATIKQAAAFAADDFALSVNGAAQQTDASCAVPTGHTTMYIGAYGNGAGHVNVMYVKDLRHWPRRLSNSELEALVGN